MNRFHSAHTTIDYKQKVIKLLSILSLFFISQINAQNNTEGNFAPPDNVQKIRVTKATSVIKVDGNLDESDWNDAIVIRDFFRRETKQGGTVKYKTEVRFL